MLVRHLTGDPPEQARRATALLARADRLQLPDVVVAELVYVLTSRYSVPRADVVAMVEAVLAFPSIRTSDHELLLRALEVYERDRLHFAEAYLVGLAEITGIRSIASFDRAIDRVDGAERIEP